MRCLTGGNYRLLSYRSSTQTKDEIVLEWLVGMVLAEVVKLLGTTSEFPTLNVLIQQFLIGGDILHRIMPKLF